MIGVAVLCTMAVTASNAAAITTVAVTPAAEAGGGGVISAIGDARRSHLQISESLVQAKKGRVFLKDLVAGTPAYQRFLQVTEESIVATRSSTATRAALTLRMVPAFTALIALLSASTTEDELKSEPWLIVREYEPGEQLHAVPPCKHLRTSGNGTQRFPTVGCPTLRRYSSERPPDLYVDAGGNVDFVLLKLLDSPPVVSSRTLLGGGGRDVILGSEHAPNAIGGGGGSDVLTGGTASDEIWGNSYRSNIDLRDPDNEPDNDVLGGSASSDLIIGDVGNDIIYGNEGDDTGLAGTLLAGDSELSLYRNGADLQGGPGSDLIVGGPGRDSMHGGRGQDTVQAKESDMGWADEIDVMADCGAQSPPLTEFFRRSRIEVVGSAALEDPIANCSREVNRPLTTTSFEQWLTHVAQLDPLFDPVPFPWERW